MALLTEKQMLKLVQKALNKKIVPTELQKAFEEKFGKFGKKESILEKLAQFADKVKGKFKKKARFKF